MPVINFSTNLVHFTLRVTGIISQLLETCQISEQIFFSSIAGMEGRKEFLNILLVIQIIYIVPVGIICLVIVAFQVTGYRLNDFVLFSYMNYIEQQARSYTPESWDKGLNIIVWIHVVILYVVFRKRECLRVQTLEDTRRQFEIEDLFRMETEFMEQLRSQGIELEDSTLDSSCV